MTSFSPCLRRFVGSLALAGSLLQTTAASAQSAAEQAATADFEKGVELYRSGNLDAALAQFERAYSVSPNYRLLYNIGQVQAQLGQFVSAIRSFEQYLSRGGDEVEPARRANIAAEIDRMGKLIARLTIETNVAGAEIFVDDQRVGEAPLKEAIPVNVGQRVVRLQKKGYESVTKKIQVAGEEKAVMMIQLDPVGPAAVRTSQEAKPTYSYTPFWVSAGATTALAGAAVTFGILTNTANNNLDTELDRLPADPRRVDQERSRVKTFAALTDGFGAGAIVGAAFAVYFLVAPPTAREPSLGWGPIRLQASASGAGLEGAF